MTAYEKWKKSQEDSAYERWKKNQQELESNNTDKKSILSERNSVLNNISQEKKNISNLILNPKNSSSDLGINAQNLSNMDKKTQNIMLRSLNNLDSKSTRKIQRELKQNEIEQQSTKDAERINNDMANGNYLSAIGHIIAGVPKKAVDTIMTTATSLDSMLPEYSKQTHKKYLNKDYDADDMLKLNKIETKQYENTTSKINNDVVKTASGISGTIGQMVPSILANAALPGSGTVVQGINVGAEAYQDTLNEDASNKEQATATGILKGTVSGLIEKIAGGNLIGKGSLDDKAASIIEKTFKGKVGQKLASKAYEIIGEIGEENLENQVGYVIDKLVNNKDMPDAQTWWNEASETIKSTFLTTVVLNLLGMGGNTYNEIQDKKTKKFVDEAKKIIRTEINNNTELNIDEKINKLNAVNNIKNVTDYNNYNANEQKRNLIQKINQDSNLNADTKTELLNNLNKIDNSEKFNEFLRKNYNDLKNLSSYQDIIENNNQGQQSISQDNKMAQNQTSNEIRNKVNNYLNNNNLNMSIDEFINKMNDVTLENETNMTPEQEELYKLISEIQENNKITLEENNDLLYNNINNSLEENYGRRENSDNRGNRQLSNEQIDFNSLTYKDYLGNIRDITENMLSAYSVDNRISKYFKFNHTDKFYDLSFDEMEKASSVVSDKIAQGNDNGFANDDRIIYYFDKDNNDSKNYSIVDFKEIKEGREEIANERDINRDSRYPISERIQQDGSSSDNQFSRNDRTSSNSIELDQEKSSSIGERNNERITNNFQINNELKESENTDSFNFDKSQNNSQNITKENFNKYSSEGFNTEPTNNLSKDNWKKYQSTKLETDKILKNKGNTIQVEKRKFAKDFIDNKFIDLRGQTVENSADIADISQIFRNPKYETFRVIYTKNNNIVGQEAISSHVPGHTNAFSDKDQGKKGYYKMKNRMERLNADGYYLIHNHPSGNAVASQQDIDTTKKFLTNVPGFKGHVIINSGTYSLIEKEFANPFNLRTYNEIKIDNYKPDSLDKMMSNEPWANKTINRDELINIAYDLKNNPNYSNLIITDAKLKGRIILDIPNTFFNMSEKQINGYIKNVSKQNGGMRAFIATQDNKIFDKLDKLGTIQDAVLFSTDENGDLNVISNMDVKSNVTIFDNKEGKGLRVNEKIEDIYNSLFNSYSKNTNLQPNNKINNTSKDIPKSKQELLDNNSKALNQYIKEKNNSIRTIESQIAQYYGKLNSLKDVNSVEANRIKSNIIKLVNKQNDIESIYNKKIDKAIEKGQKLISTPDMSGRAAVIQKNRELAKERIKNIARWKDKSNGLKYQRETMERNMFDIMPNKQEAQQMIDTYFEPIHEAEANKQRFINSYNDKIKELNLNKYESEAVQLLGEQKYNPDFKSDDVKPVLDRVNENIEKGKIDRTKVDQAIETFRNIYDELFELENQALKENGYPEKPYRKGYFPHFIDAEPVNKFEKVLEKIGFKVDKRPLPTDIAGITEQFVPGKTWNRSSLRRKTDTTTYNALKGFDTYISQAADNIYHTENIQKLRALENEIRYQYSEKGVQDRIDEIYNNDVLSQEEQQAAIENIFEQVENPMPNLVVELRRYTNALANKKSEADRSAEQKYGRQLYSTVNAIENRFGANAVGLNIGSAITNFIPITQAYSQVSTKNMGRAVIDTIKSYINDDGFVDNSTFLTSRLNQAEKLYKTDLEKISDKTSFLFNAIDNVASNIVVRGKYLQNLDEGMNVQEAMKNADRFGANLMADRSKGAMPTLFNEKSPLTKVFTQFQLEVNNQYSYMFKDMPRDLKDKGIANLALAFFKMFIAAFFYNKASEEIVGRKSAFSPIDIAIDSYKTLSDKNASTADKVINVGKDIAEELPFVGGFLGGGRIPISGALPDGENTFKAATGLVTGEMDSKKALSTLGKELSKPAYYLLPPFGGGQLKKTVEGVSTVANGGSYGVDSKGNDTLQFLVEDANAGDYIKAGLFGKYALNNAKEYANRGYKSLNAKQTQMYKEANVPYKELLDYIEQKLTTKEAKISYIENKDLNENQKWGIYKYDILSNTERKDGGSQLSDAEYMINNGMTKKQYIDMYNMAQKNNLNIPTEKEYKELKENEISINNYMDYKSKTKQYQKDIDKIQVLLNSNYSNKEIKSLYESEIKSKNDISYDIISKSGIDIKEYLKYKQQEFESDKKDDGTTRGKTVSGSKKAKVYNYVNSMNITYNQKLLLLGMQYNLTSAEKTKLANYVNSMKLKKQEKLDIYEKLSGFTVYKDGRVTW